MAEMCFEWIGIEGIAPGPALAEPDSPDDGKASKEQKE